MQPHYAFACCVCLGGRRAHHVDQKSPTSVSFCGHPATTDRKVLCGSLPHLKPTRTFFDPRNFQKSRGCTDDVANFTKRYLFGHHVFSHFRRGDDDLLGPPSSLSSLDGTTYHRLIQNSPTPLRLREMLDPGLLVKLTNHALVDGTS